MSVKTILNKIKEVATEVVKLENVDAEVIVEEVKLAQESLDNGTIVEAESFEAGQPVFIVNEDERVPLPVGEYEKEGMLLIVEEEGIIAEIREAVAEEEAEPEAEVEAESEYVTVDDFNKAIDEIKSMLSKEKESKEELETELILSKEKAVELQKELDEVPDAKSIKVQPKEKVKLSEPTTKKGRIYQFLNSK